MLGSLCLASHASSSQIEQQDINEIKPGMMICLEGYFGAEDEPEGVKLEDQVEVTETGCRVQIPYPFSHVLLG